MDPAVSAGPQPSAPASSASDVDTERRFGGLRRLYGSPCYERMRALSVAVVGLGGVGSWATEALARHGVARLVLIDMDHVAESNINRQIQALTATVGQAKAEALAQRIAGIHPACCVQVIDDFAGPDNWPFPAVADVDVVIDACDDGQAKEVMAQWALRCDRDLVVCGAAGGKCQPQYTEVADLAQVTHDPLLSRLRQRLRRSGHWPAASAPCPPQVRLCCVFSREPLRRPEGTCDMQSSLSCHGYGSSVSVTASFGLVAATAAIHLALGLSAAYRAG